MEREGAKGQDGALPVLFLTYGLSVGGAETMLVSLINALERSRITPVVLSLAPRAALEDRLDPSVRLLRAERRWKFDISPAARIARALEAEDIRTVFALGMFAYLFLRRSLRRRPGTRTFVSLHTTKPRSTKELLMTKAYARLIRPADTLVTVCRSQADFLSSLYGLPRSQFRTIYNGVDTRRWVPAPPDFDRERFRSELGIPAGTPMVLQVAHFRAEKRQVDAVRALAIARRGAEPGPVLVFVGGGEERLREETRAVAASLGVAPFVRFCGPQADPLPFYWAADLFTLSSNSETFPISVLEALATGLPAVMTDLGGAREVIEEGENGAIALPEQPETLAGAWRKILDRPESVDRNRIRERAVGRFSLAAFVDQYERLLRDEGGCCP